MPDFISAAERSEPAGRPASPTYDAHVLIGRLRSPQLGPLQMPTPRRGSRRFDRIELRRASADQSNPTFLLRVATT